MSREAADAFLARHGFADARRLPLAQDASFRRYWRIEGGARPAVLMDAPPPEDVRPFLRVGRHLASIGVSVPDVLGADPDLGLLLLEDFGDHLFSSLFSAETGEDQFDAAVDLLAAIQRVPPPADLPAWDAAAMGETAASTLLDWWWPASFGATAPNEARGDFSGALATLLAPLARTEPVFVHRDFFAGNLVWLPDRTGAQRVGVLDFQSAARGHPAYDLASLVEDARRDVPADLAARCVRRFLAARPELAEGPFRDALAICAVQRHMRVAGQWVRLALRDRRPHYLAHGPRTWRRLGVALGHPAAAALAAAFDRWIPPERRANPPGPVA